MKVRKVISKSKDGTRREVITETSKGVLRTHHVHQDRNGKWRYCSGGVKGLYSILEEVVG